jgi:hypothetical protein
MNIVDRGKILNNILQLIELTDYTQMKEACLRKEILFDPMIEKIEVIFSLFNFTISSNFFLLA